MTTLGVTSNFWGAAPTIIAIYDWQFNAAKTKGAFLKVQRSLQNEPKEKVAAMADHPSLKMASRRTKCQVIALNRKYNRVLVADLDMGKVAA